MAKRGRPKKNTEVEALVEKIAELTEERNIAQKLAEERLATNQTLAKQLTQAEDTTKDFIAEIRLYEHETSLLRQIIIDALTGNN